jgi:hypothetical protein
MVTWNGASLYTRDDIAIRTIATWAEVMTSLFARVDKYKRDLVIKIPLKLWGAYENLGVLFPAAVLTPIPGFSLFGSSDLPLVINARNSDRITFANAQITKLIDLQIGVDGELFSADLEMTCLLKNNTLPETAGSYYVIDTNAFADAGFAKTNFVRARATGAWAAITGFTAIVPQTGFKLAWDLKLTPFVADGYGTVDMTLDDFSGSVRFIPIQPTLAQIKTNAQIEAPMGTLLSAISGDFTITAAGTPSQSIVLKSAGMIESGWVFGANPLRIGEMALETTRGFTAGVANATATIA